MSLIERLRADEARRQREQREDLEALSHATGGYSPRRSLTARPNLDNGWAARAARHELPASDRTFGR